METLIYPTKTKANKEHKCNFCNGLIQKSEIYLKSSHKFDGDIYTWKSHEKCSELASKLNWYENCDYGLTQEDFIESAKNEYQNIMSENFNELYESKDFVYPKFKEQLEFIINHHLINP